MPLLVVLVIAWMVSGAWKGAKEETKNQARKGTAALQALTAKNAQNSEAGRRAATLARGVGHVLKFAAVAALLTWGAVKAIGRAALDGAAEGRQRGRDDYVNRTDNPHSAADSQAFNPRRCPLCHADFVPGDRAAGQAPWIHPAGSTCPNAPGPESPWADGCTCDITGVADGDICPECGAVGPKAGINPGGSADADKHNAGVPDPKPGPTKPTCAGCGVRLRRRVIDDGNGGKVRTTVHEDTNRRECAPKPTGPKPSPNGNGGRPDPGRDRGGSRPNVPRCVGDNEDGCGVELVRGGRGQARWVHPAGSTCPRSGENSSPLPDPNATGRARH